ncbi:hypothetical protein CRG98_001933 [Punica granatum]|uniref:Uncharacterized protein n=1 Tax=Punica granatum TaxID=22663 RepID=A0A2I0LAI9_PUNGR|nr:hypothetical protein CRG98_001933 [Punica granatum]
MWNHQTKWHNPSRPPEQCFKGLRCTFQVLRVTSVAAPASRRSVTLVCARRRARFCSSTPARAPAPVIAPVSCACAPRTFILHACTCMHVQRPRTSRTLADAPARPPMLVRVRAYLCPGLLALPPARLCPCRACARPRTSSFTLQRPRTLLPLHPNVLRRIPPSHPTLKPFPDSFLASRG